MKIVTRYPLSMSLLHWLLAAALVGNLIIGLLLDDNEDLVGLHKSIGIVILCLVLARIANRLRVQHRLPTSANPACSAARLAEHAVHGLLYVLMFTIPMIGWMKTNAAGHTASCFGLFSLPTLVPKSRALSHWLGELHALTAYGLAVVVGFHVLGAMAHRVIRAENILPRILPWPTRTDQHEARTEDIVRRREYDAR
ncbi:cytochrome B561 [Burkholderia contaminans FFH2055]|uniref:cytochrome b n=1 Tax=Burkholderia contaminans TaxID=488447 RepID=UPI00062573EE|nr:cytochrome b/b6 domain-containing protein [Burkholderia contaminans]KKL31130.1 cytochrome B561 [Burkholderia contaminans FFH2055]MEB4634294.1 cytochrome b/b6 domain-containing protein [Burkholderia contaminans]MEB4642059.1 cytochrome b/b6 domain-containing protein [Burkholderia contaminans]MEB4657054.1 cytochrome b/b6 domain-containing protein [Burkholderia contaminans]MEB4665091.1 cytochrome b/b6 domain-containing protein [Burkholderia contaminans]